MTPDHRARAVTLAAILFLIAGALAPLIYMLGRAVMTLGDATGLAVLISGSSRQRALLVTTLQLACGTALGATAIGAPLAFFLTRLSFPGRTIFFLLVPLPLLIPSYVHTVCWIHLLAPTGWVPTHLPGLAHGLPSIYSLPGATWVLALSYYPIVTLLTWAGFSRQDADLEDAARIQAGQTHALLQVSWRLALPAVFAGTLFVFILALSNFAVPSMLRVPVYAMEIFHCFATLQQTDRAVLLALPLLLFSLAALTAILRLEKSPRYAIASAARRPGLLAAGRTGRWGTTFFSGVVLLFSVVIPLALLFQMTGSWQEWINALANARHDILVSFWTAILAASLTTALGAGLAFTVDTASRWKGHLVATSAVLSFAFPASAAGIGIVGIWNRGAPMGWVYGSVIILVVAYFCRYVALAIKPLRMAMLSIDPCLQESARLDAVSWWQTVRHALTPLCAAAIMAAWLLVYIFALTDLDTAILVHPPGSGTVPVRIYNLLHFGRQQWVGALSLVLIAMTLVPCAVALLIGEKAFNVSFEMHRRS